MFIDKNPFRGAKICSYTPANRRMSYKTIIHSAVQEEERKKDFI